MELVTPAFKSFLLRLTLKGALRPLTQCGAVQQL